MELIERTDKELKELAKKFKIPGYNKMKKPDLVEAIEKAHIKMKVKLEAEARAELAKEAENKLKALGIDPKKKFKPSHETIMIEGGFDYISKKKVEPSKRKYYTFHNLEEDGVKIPLRKGEKYRFELYDGRIHCLPVWLVENLRKTATYPIYAQRINPNTGLEYSAHVGNRPRMGFDELEDAPDDTPFGVVIDKALEAKHLPAPVLS